MLLARSAGIAVGLTLLVAGCSPNNHTDCGPHPEPSCHGNSVVTCTTVYDTSCDESEACYQQAVTTEQPCPADLPVCEELPHDASGAQVAACQKADLDKSCTLVGIENATGAGPDLVGDLDGDGHTDFVSVTLGGTVVVDGGAASIPNLYAVFLGAGDGTFRKLAPQPSPDWLGAQGAALGDFNGDGKLDLAFSQLHIPLSVAFGRGDGTFEGNAPVPNAGDDFQIFATADVNGDHIDDLIGFEDEDQAIVVVLGSRSQLVVMPPQVPCGSSTCLPIAPGDFDGDGYADVLVGGGGQVGVVRGRPDGLLTPPASFQAAAWASDDWYGKYPSLVLAQDVDGDGRIDLVVPDGQGSAVQLGRGDGTFSPPAPVSAAPYSAVVAFVGDENGDGLADLFMYDKNARVLALRRGAGGGVFDAPLFYQPSAYGLRVAGVLDSGIAGHHDLLIDSGFEGPSVLPGRCR